MGGNGRNFQNGALLSRGNVSLDMRWWCWDPFSAVSGASHNRSEILWHDRVDSWPCENRLSLNFRTLFIVYVKRTVRLSYPFSFSLFSIPVGDRQWSLPANPREGDRSLVSEAPWWKSPLLSLWHSLAIITPGEEETDQWPVIVIMYGPDIMNGASVTSGEQVRHCHISLRHNHALNMLHVSRVTLQHLIWTFKVHFCKWDPNSNGWRKFSLFSMFSK